MQKAIGNHFAYCQLPTAYCSQLINDFAQLVNEISKDSSTVVLSKPEYEVVLENLLSL